MEYTKNVDLKNTTLYQISGESHAMLELVGNKLYELPIREDVSFTASYRDRMWSYIMWLTINGDQ